MVDQLAEEYAGSPVYFLEYPADNAPSNRYGRWWAAYGGSSSVYLPLIMVDSGNQISNGPVDFYNVYKSMVETALVRPAKAAITAYVLRCGNKIRFFVRLTNHSGTPLSYSLNNATIHAAVWESAQVARTGRYVRASVSTSITSSLADGSSAEFILDTPELTGVDWDKLHTVVLADYRPEGLTGAFDTLGAALAPRASVMRQDFDTDGRQDITIRRPNTGVWYALSSVSPGAYTSTKWGLQSDTPVPGDYDGDGKTDIGVWRPGNGTWYIRPTAIPGTYTTSAWGFASDIPVPGEYDSDGKADIAVFRPSTGTWYVRPSGSPSSYTATNWGTATDIPVPGDYNGDGKTDMAVWRPGTGTWFIKPSGSDSYTTTRWGASSDIPVPGDYDGDGKADISVWRPGNGTWYLRSSASPETYTTSKWGTNGDVPVPGDYDGDGKADIGVWRPGNGTWYMRPSASPGSYTAKKWGMATDEPISPITGIVKSLP